jgi:hypothetical protein
VGANDFPLDVAGDNASQDSIRIKSANSTNITLDLYDSGGTLRKRYVNNPINDNAWQLLAVSYDTVVGGAGAGGLEFYVNGVATSPTKNQDAACPMNPWERISVGSAIGGSALAKGIYHSVMIWSSILTADELLTVYNGGDGENFNPQEDSGDYVSSANLVRWYRLGMDADNIGIDTVTPANSNLMDQASNVTSDDIVEDGPT